VGKPEGTDHFKDLGIDERIVLKWTFRKWRGGGDMDSIDLAQNRDR